MDYYAGRALIGSKEGKTSSDLKITQNQLGLLNSIYVLKNIDAWYAECIIDDRDPSKTDGNPLYQEVRLYHGKINAVTEGKGDAEAIFTVEGSGRYDISNKKILQRGVTPTAVTISGATGLVAGSTMSLTISATDIYGDAIVLTDITVADLMNEIDSITVEEQSASTVTFTQSAGTASNIVKITASTTTPGSIVLKGKISCSNSGNWYSINKTITYTTV